MDAMYAESAASPRRGLGGAMTLRPRCCRDGMTPFQLEASAKAPCTSTTVTSVERDAASAEETSALLVGCRSVSWLGTAEGWRIRQPVRRGPSVAFTARPRTPPQRGCPSLRLTRGGRFWRTVSFDTPPDVTIDDRSTCSQVAASNGPCDRSALRWPQ